MDKEQQLIQDKYLPFAEDSYVKTSALKELVLQQNNQEKQLKELKKTHNQLASWRSATVNYIKENQQPLLPKLQAKKNYYAKTDPNQWKKEAQKLYPTSHSRAALVMAFIAFCILAYWAPFRTMSVFRFMRPWEQIIATLAIVGIVYVVSYFLFYKSSLDNRKNYCKEQAALRDGELNNQVDAENNKIDANNQRIQQQIDQQNAQRAQNAQAAKNELNLYDQQMAQIKSVQNIIQNNIAALQKEEKHITDYMEQQRGPMKLRHDSDIFDSDYWLNVYDNLNSGGSRTFGDALMVAHEDALQNRNTRSITNSINNQTMTLTKALMLLGQSVSIQLNQLGAIGQSIAQNNEKNFKILEQGVSDINQTVRNSNELVKKANQNLTNLSKSVYCVNKKLDVLHSDNLAMINGINQVHSAIFAASAASTAVETAAINQASAATTAAIHQASTANAAAIHRASVDNTSVIKRY